MKFERSLPSRVDPATGDIAPARFTLEHGPLAGQSFDATFRICPNPTCTCETVGFACQPVVGPDTADAGNPPARELVEFDVDVFARKINRHTRIAPKQIALAKAVVAELQPSDWHTLGQLFLASKRHRMETMDLDTLQAQFPRAVLAGRGTMVGYPEVFPWGLQFEFTLADERWFADDQYCVVPGCDCTEPALSFYHLPRIDISPLRPLKDDVTLYYNYVSGQTKVLEAKPGNPAADALMSALRATHPDLDQKLRRRHHQLKQLGQRLLVKPRPGSNHPIASLPTLDRGSGEPPSLLPAARVTRQPKVGRNDPCPCGSGKKYKKCCGV